LREKIPGVNQARVVDLGMPFMPTEACQLGCRGSNSRAVLNSIAATEAEPKAKDEASWLAGP
jgi:hypothetical protein